MQDEVIVFHPEDADKAKQAVAGRSFTWLYLGQDTVQRENISVVMGGQNRRLTGDLLLETAEKQKQPFLDFLAGLGREQKNRRYWWASDIAYRSPLTSDFFQVWCYAALFDELCAEARTKHQSLVIFISDRWLYLHLQEKARSSNSRILFKSSVRLWPEAVKLSARFIAYRLYFLQRAIRYYVNARRSTGQNQRSVPHQTGKSERRVYLYSWIQERFFNAKGEFHDAYFGWLPAILAKNGIKITYITPMFLPENLKRKCLAHGGFEFTFLDSYLHLRDILKSFFAFFSVSIGKEARHLKTLIRRQALREIFFHNHIAYYHAYKSWLKKIDGESITIIYPFENQPSEKMLCLAARETGKKIRLIAYQHSTVPSFLLNYFAGAGESTNMPLPDCIVADSTSTLEKLGKAGYGATKLVNGGALRYEYLHHTTGNRPLQKPNRPKTVLIALPYTVGLTEEMLLATYNAFAEMSTIEVLIKYHPAVNPESLRIKLPPRPAHFKETKKDIMELLPEIDLVVCWSSTMVLEMFLTGVPVVRYRSEYHIGVDSREEMKEINVKSCSENDLRDVAITALNEAGQAGAAHSGDADRFFSPVNEEVWLEVVQC
jgi:surface carbohydrate biosynthesis protein (TIGR04326 family)